MLAPEDVLPPTSNYQTRPRLHKLQATSAASPATYFQYKAHSPPHCIYHTVLLTLRVSATSPLDNVLLQPSPTTSLRRPGATQPPILPINIPSSSIRPYHPLASTIWRLCIFASICPLPLLQCRPGLRRKLYVRRRRRVWANGRTRRAEDRVASCIWD